MDDVAQDLFSRRVAPVQFPFRDFPRAWTLRESPGPASLKENDLSFLTLMNPVDNFMATLFLGVMVTVMVGVSPDRLVACDVDTRPVWDPS